MTRWIALPILAACTSSPDPDPDPTGRVDITIPFEVVVGEEPAVCGEDLTLGAVGSIVELQDLRFFISDLTLVDEAGAEAAITLDATSPWQVEHAVLIDAEDATGGCSTAGNPQTNTEATGTVDSGAWTHLRFGLGLPFDLNHGDGSTAAPPLNVSAMFWSWQAGHKFARVDLAVGDEGDAWFFHLGSTGCTSSGAVIAPELSCDQPNLATITIPFDPDADTVRLDLGTLLGGVDVSTTLEGSLGCLTAPDEEAVCRPIFDALGMDWDSGACVDDCAGQTSFSTP